MRCFAIAVFALLAGAPAGAAQGPETGSARPTVFMDCRAHCDLDFLREEIRYVTWVRDRTVADVHLLVTAQGAGAGGTQYALAFLGQGPAAARSDTLRYTTDPTMTADETRRGLAQHIAIGLVPFVVASGNAHLLRITGADADDDDAGGPARAAGIRDPWRAWVFEIGVDGGLSGQALYRSKRLNGSAEARRVTEEWKVNSEFDYEYEDDRIIDQQYDDAGNPTTSETFTNLQRNWEGNLLVVRSLGQHLSAGAQAELASNIFRNLRQALQVGPAVEYSFYPYREATRRELIARYGAGYEINRYVDTTIFDRTREALPVHSLLVNYRTQQPWGSTGARIEHRNYLRDAAKRNTELGGHMSVRLFRGFNLNAHGEYSWIRDQVTLRKGAGDQTDVLLRRRELLTGYDYSAGIGLSYTFGSIYSNVVNPRF